MCHNYGQVSYAEVEVDNSDRSLWNQYVAKVYGADSVIIIINGMILSKVYDIRSANPDETAGEPLVSGGIGLQSEGAEIHYKEFELIGIDPDTRLRIVPACMDSTFEEYEAYQTDFPADMYTLVSDTSRCLTKKPVGNNDRRPDSKLLQSIDVFSEGTQIFISIKGYENKPVKITGISGRSIANGNTDSAGRFKISKRAIPHGIYFVRLQGNKAVVSRHLMLD